jgi:hypothetical protein
MALIDRVKEKAFAVVRAPAALTTTYTSAAIDTANASGVTVIVETGAWTDGTHTPKLQECATSGGSYTDVAAADQQGTFTAIAGAGQQNAIQAVGYIGRLEFLKVVVTVAGATTGVILGCHTVMDSRRLQP